MLPQGDILGIVAELTSEQVDAADIGGILSDTNPHRDGLTGFQRQIAEGNFRYLHTIDETSFVCDFPNLKQAIL